MFGSFTDAYKKAVNIVYLYVRIGSMKEVVVGFAEIMRECMLTIYGWTGIEQILPQISEVEAMQAWEQLQAQVKDIGSLDAWRKFALNSANAMLGGSAPPSEVRMYPAQQSPKKFAIVIGEYEEGASFFNEIRGAVTHDVKGFYTALEDRGYTMITLPGKQYNLQLNRSEINMTFKYLRENLTNYPGSFVFMAFVGHGTVTEMGGCYLLGDGTKYSFVDMAYDFDIRILDRNGDGKITSTEQENTLYSKLVVVFQTCVSKWGIDAFKQRDRSSGPNRILISACDYNEKSFCIDLHTGWGFTFFAGHLINKLTGNYGEEFIMSFLQSLLGSLSFLFVSIPSLFKWLKVLSALSFLCLLILCLLVFSVVWGVMAVHDMSTLGNTLYDAVDWGNKWARYGLGFGVWTSTPHIYNGDLAKGVIL